MIAAACYHHPDRLAAAKCLECSRSYCRECVTEHQGRLICAACLRKSAPAAVARRNWLRPLLFPVMGIAALCGSWLIFYTSGWWLEQATTPPARVVPR
jgi:hypothetical protein